MKAASPALAAHLGGDVTTLCTCWKVTRTDGLVMGFTDRDRDVEIDGVTYAASTGYTPSAIATSADLAASNLEVDVVLDSAGITDLDLRSGRYDHADIEVLMANWASLADGAIILSRGTMGEVKLEGMIATAEVRGLAQAFITNLGEYFSTDCRATFGDDRCKIDLAAHTVSGTITSVASRRSFTSSASGTFDGGEVSFTSGPCVGLSMEVKTGTGGSVTLFMPMPRAFAAGDTFTIRPGCDRSTATCRQVYNNIVNFRGEPFVPGTDAILAYPNAN